MKIIVTGVTLTGNMGGYAMLLAIHDVLSSDIKDIAVSSILPKDDKLINKDKKLFRIISSDYRILMLLIMPLCLLLWPFRKKKFVIWLSNKIPILKDFANVDAVVDLSGISFVDGRGLGLLIYNISIVLPGLFFNKPTYKLSQSLGPFKDVMNRFVSKWLLSKCREVVARGVNTLEHLRNLEINRASHYPDTSFAMEIPENIILTAKRMINNKIKNKDQIKLVIISPSMVVKNYCKKSGLNLVNELSETIYQLSKKNIHCALLAHSTYSGISKNDDLCVVNEIISNVKLNYNIDLPHFDAKGDPRLARAIIGCADVFLACRFHALIAALSQSVPVLTIGWSHKYFEAASPFDMEKYTINYLDTNKDHLVYLISKLLIDKEKYSDKMIKIAIESKKKAIEGIKIIFNKN